MATPSSHSNKPTTTLEEELAATNTDLTALRGKHQAWTRAEKGWEEEEGMLESRDREGVESLPVHHDHS